MSFILDALKRADRERRLERAPDLSAVLEEDNLPRRSIQPWLWLSGSFLVGAMVVALILWPERPGPVRSPLPKDTSVSRTVPAPETTQKQKTPPLLAASDSKPAQPKPVPTPAPAPQPRPKPARETVQVAKAVPETASGPAVKTPETQPVTKAEVPPATPPAPVAAVKKKALAQPSPSVSPAPKTTAL